MAIDPISCSAFTVHLISIHVICCYLIFLQILSSFSGAYKCVVILRMTRGNSNPPPPPPPPPFAEMLTQLTQVVAQLAQQQANQMLHPNNHNEGNGRVSLRDFLNLNPRVFASSAEPLDADDWLREMNRTLVTAARRTAVCPVFAGSMAGSVQCV